MVNRDYFMVGECVRFLFTSCEGSLNKRVSAANEWIIKSYKRTNHEVICLLYEYKDEYRDIKYLIYWRTTKYKRKIKTKFLTIWRFVFVQKIQPWGLFHLNETTNVFLHDLSRFFSLLSKLTKSDSMFTLACEQVLNFFGKKMSANQNAHTTFFTCEKYSMQWNTNISAEYFM